MHIDISIQDIKHYGLKCVDLVKEYLKEYEALEPLIFSLKNLLKMADLNDPYKGGVSSYGLILMIVSFLQGKKDKNLQINILSNSIDNNLGRLFVEFLHYYGVKFDNSKYILCSKAVDNYIIENEFLADLNTSNVKKFFS